PDVLNGEIIEKNGIHGGAESRKKLLAAIHLHLQKDSRGSAPEGTDPVFYLAPPEAPEDSNVVVLEENRVRQAFSVIFGAARSYRVLLEAPPAGRRLSSIEEPGPRPGDGLHPAPCMGGYPAEALEEVQGGPLQAEDGTSCPLDRKEGDA